MKSSNILTLETRNVPVAGEKRAPDLKSEIFGVNLKSMEARKTVKKCYKSPNIVTPTPTPTVNVETPLISVQTVNICPPKRHIGKGNMKMLKNVHRSNSKCDVNRIENNENSAIDANNDVNRSVIEACDELLKKNP